MADDKSKEKEVEGDDGDGEAKEGKARWLFGWVVVPGFVITAIFVAGVHVGANYPDLWLSRLIAWIGS